MAQTSTAADFGSPPSGQIPILYNDHHVYTKPDVLKQGRVLSGLRQGRHDLSAVALDVRSRWAPRLRSIASGQTATVTKAGRDDRS